MKIWYDGKVRECVQIKEDEKEPMMVKCDKCGEISEASGLWRREDYTNGFVFHKPDCLGRMWPIKEEEKKPMMVKCDKCGKVDLAKFMERDYEEGIILHDACDGFFRPFSDTTKQNDPINKPAHYAETVPGVECIDVTKHFSFLRGNAIKYLWRAGVKNPEKKVEDLKKAIWYIQKEIEESEK